MACVVLAAATESVVALSLDQNKIPTLSAEAQPYVTSITRAEKIMPVPLDLNATANFFTDGRLQLQLHDSVNVMNCQFEVTEGGFAARQQNTTLVAYGGNDLTRLLLIEAIGTLASAEQVSAAVTNDSLTLTTGEFRLSLTRRVVAGGNNPPATTFR